MRRDTKEWLFGFMVSACLVFVLGLLVFGYSACTATWKCSNLGAENVSWFPNCVCERDGQRFQCDRADAD